MKKMYQSLTASKFQLAGIIAAAAIFSFFLFGFNGKQNPSEKLLGLSFNYDKNEVTIHVVTNGCTAKNDFTIKVSGSTINVIRKKRDFCKAMPEATSFTYDMKTLGIDANKLYTIKNKFIANTNLANIP